MLDLLGNLRALQVPLRELHPAADRTALAALACPLT
jgi:hypothetical protein